jgi:hypothetical protein
MVTNPTENSREYIGIIVDRDDPNGLGGHKVFIPQLHSTNVNPDHLPWVRYVVPPGGGGGSTNYGALDTGQVVSIRKDVGEGGTGFGTITGLYQTKQKADPNMPGNVSLIKGLQQIAQALEKEMNVRVRPETEEVIVDGAKVRQAVEKGLKHKHALLKELMSHAATFPLNGTHLPDLKNISTGVEASLKQLTAEMQSLLPGTSVNLNQILSVIPETLLNELKDAIPASMFTALENTTALMGGVTTSASSGSSSGNRKVDLEVFIAQLVELLKTAKTPADITRIFSELSTNTAIGAISSEAINLAVETPYGEMTQVIDPVTGAISLSIPNNVEKAIQSFGSLMTSLPGANGNTMYNSGAAAMFNLIRRLKKDAENKAKKKHEDNVNNGTTARTKQNEAARTFLSSTDDFIQPVDPKDWKQPTF